VGVLIDTGPGQGWEATIEGDDAKTRQEKKSILETLLYSIHCICIHVLYEKYNHPATRHMVSSAGQDSRQSINDFQSQSKQNDNEVESLHNQFPTHQTGGPSRHGLCTTNESLHGAGAGMSAMDTT